MCRVFSCVVRRGCFIFVCIPTPNLHVTPVVSWFPTFKFQSPMMKRTSFLGAGFISKWRSRETRVHLLLREHQNYNSLLNYYRQKNVGSHPKRIPHVQGQRRSPSKMVERVKSHLEPKPRPPRHTQGLKQNLCAPEDLTETEPDLPLSVWVSPVEAQVNSGLLQGQGLWLQQTWDTQHVA